MIDLLVGNAAVRVECQSTAVIVKVRYRLTTATFASEVYLKLEWCYSSNSRAAAFSLNLTTSIVVASRLSTDP